MLQEGQVEKTKDLRTVIIKVADVTLQHSVLQFPP